MGGDDITGGVPRFHVLLACIDDGVGQAADRPHDGRGAVAHAVHLVEAAGFEAGGHQEGVGAGLDLMGQFFTVADVHGNAAGPGFGGVPQGSFEALLAAAEMRERGADVEPDDDTTRLLHRTIDTVRTEMDALRFNTAIAKLIELNNEVTKLDAGKLREMVAAYRRARGAALYCSTGVNMGQRGALAFWIQEVINAISGNLDRPGGTLVGRGLVDFPTFARNNGILMRQDRSRVGGLPTVNDALPGGVLADEILTEGPGQHRALFVTGGNPLITMANAGRLREAFEQLDLLVSLDIQQGETASLAHYVLPCTSPLERPDLPFIFPLFLGMQSRPYLQATEAVAVPQGEQRDEASIYLDLCRAADAPIFGSRLAQRALEAARALAPRSANGQPALPQEALLSLLLKLGGAPSFGAMVRDHPHGIPRPRNRGDSYLGQRVLTEDGKVDLAPPPLLEAAAGLEEAFAVERRDARRLKLITKRAVTTHNSWTHNHRRFVGRGTNYLYMHPADAEARGLKDGDLADVTSEVATVRVPIRRLADLMEGTVALPHGWGHQRAPHLSVASRTRGVNVNLLAADGPDALEPVGGMARLTGIVVKVTKATGPQAPTWSGLEEPTPRSPG